MTTITNLRMWADTGYTDGATEIPPLDHVFPRPDITFDEEIHPSKDRMFTQFQIPLGYSYLLPMSYMNFDLEMDNGENINVYAWIDDVQLRSDTEGSPMTYINWHVDPWMTFGKDARYGSGHVVRRPSSQYDIYQNFQYKYKQLGPKNYDLLNKRCGNVDIDWWALLCVQSQNDDNKVSYIQWMAIPLEPRTGSHNPYNLSDGDTVRHTLTSRQIMAATFDELLGFDPSTVTGAWLCPMCPIPGGISGSGTYDSPFTTTSRGWSVRMPTVANGRACFATDRSLSTGEKVFSKQTFNFTESTSLEGDELYLSDPIGQSIGAIPFGRTVHNGSVYLTAGSTTASLRFEMSNGEPIEGLVFEYPLPMIDVNSNSWSSYVYSGQRQYDIDQRNLNSTSRMIEGAASGGAIGSLIGGTGSTGNKSKNATKAGAAVAKAGVSPAGMVTGMLVGSIGSLVSGALELSVINNEFQGTEDRFHAAQSETILLSGSCLDYIFYGSDGQISLVDLVFDPYSRGLVSDLKQVQGVYLNTPVVDCSSLIAAGGPLQITNLIVKGAIPTTAKKWIANKFASGVRIVER